LSNISNLEKNLDRVAGFTGREFRAWGRPGGAGWANHPPAGGLALTAALAILVLSSCAANTPITASSRADPMGAAGEPSFAQFTDIPIPAGASMDLERSLVLGDRETWIGRVVMDVSENASRIYDFYFDEMPKFEWSPVTMVRAGTSVLTYTRGERVATIQIVRGRISGATISVTVSPRGGAVRTGGGAGMQGMSPK
jgi:hypothetical protein